MTSPAIRPFAGRAVLVQGLTGHPPEEKPVTLQSLLEQTLYLSGMTAVVRITKEVGDITGFCVKVGTEETLVPLNKDVLKKENPLDYISERLVALGVTAKKTRTGTHCVPTDYLKTIEPVK
jgi:hypothetical protein